MFNRKTFNQLRYELLFIGLSVLVIVGIGLLPKSSPTPAAPVATVAPIPVLVKKVELIALEMADADKLTQQMTDDTANKCYLMPTILTKRMFSY